MARYFGRPARRSHGREGELQCRLHGHKVASFRRGKEGLEVTLDTCGWLTVTTMAAMKDYLAAMRVKGSVGRAKGGFTARVYLGHGSAAHDHYEELVSPDNRRISFTVPWEALRAR